MKRTTVTALSIAALSALPSHASARNHRGVDVTDLVAFLDCMAGPNTGLPSGCDDVDFDLDGDVDLADFQAFQVDLEPFIPPWPPHIGGLWHSGCRDRAGDTAPWCPPDEVEFTVVDNTLNVVHRNGSYNCCLDYIEVVLHVEGNVLTLLEQEVLTHPCLCICCYDVEATVVDLAPGPYVVEYCVDDYDNPFECYVEHIWIP